MSDLSPLRLRPGDRLLAPFVSPKDGNSRETEIRIVDHSPGYAGRHLYRACLSTPASSPAWLSAAGDDFLLRTESFHCHSIVFRALSWQILIRRAAERLLGMESFIAEPRALLSAPGLNLCGHLQTWIDGRPWRLEMDERVFSRPNPDRIPGYLLPADFSSEFTAKRFFMARLARLLREMGADNLAGLYDWTWTAPLRVLLRLSNEDDVYRHLTAWHFPCPGNNPETLFDFVKSHAGMFDDLQPVVDRLRSSTPQPTVDSSGHYFPADPSLTPSAHATDIRLIDIGRIVFKPASRNAWMLEQVRKGRQAGMLSPTEEQIIVSQISNPFIQLYLQCLAVHLCMLPLTNIVVLAGGAAYAWTHDLPWADGIKIILLSLAFFAIFPMSPGSLARGLFVVLVAWKKKRMRGLRTAMFLSFWRYVGYLAFPIQMAATFPALSRFMAARWATETVHLIPHAGRPGGLLEHRVFDLFFNVPISMGRAWRERRSKRRGI